MGKCKPSQLCRMTAYNLAKASGEIISLAGKLGQTKYEHEIIMNNLRQENADLEAENSRMKLSLDGIENIHKEKVSSLKENLVTQHRSILSQHTELYKSKLHEVLDQQSNLQIR